VLERRDPGPGHLGQQHDRVAVDLVAARRHRPGDPAASVRLVAGRFAVDDGGVFDQRLVDRLALIHRRRLEDQTGGGHRVTEIRQQRLRFVDLELVESADPHQPGGALRHHREQRQTARLVEDLVEPQRPVLAVEAAKRPRLRIPGRIGKRALQHLQRSAPQCCFAAQNQIHRFGMTAFDGRSQFGDVDALTRH